MDTRFLSACMAISIITLTTGCLTATTETMQDGSKKFRLVNKPSGSTDAITGDSVAMNNGVISLLPVANPLKDQWPLYLNGKFPYNCTVELLYASKSGATALRERADKECRQEYLIRQGELKRIGKPYDLSAPRFGSNANAEKAYWQNLVMQTLISLRNANSFTIRFAKLPTVSNGQIFVQPTFGESLANDYVNVKIEPKAVPIALSDAAFSQRIVDRMGVNQWVACDAQLEFLRTVDHQTGFNYGRYEIQFKPSQLGCKEALARHQ